VAIDSGLLRNGVPLPPGYGARLDERVVEYPWVYARLPDRPGAMLDAGSALNHLFLLERPPVSRANLTICTLAREKRCYARRGIAYVYDDLRHSRFAPTTFDTIVSISTIEHIGLDNAMLYTDDASKAESDQGGYRAAVREFRRLIRPGGNCFITVPYGRAANHRWFQIFDAPMIENILADFNPSVSEIEYFGYSPDGWRSVRAEDLSEATFFDIHEQKDYDADFAAGARGVACMRLTA
jgi:SAM-dependent methyltransferase